MIMPDSSKYGFIIIHEDMLKGIYGQKIYNQICVKLAPGADVSEVKMRLVDCSEMILLKCRKRRR